MTNLQLFPREESDTMFWIKGQDGHFLSFREDGAELWRSNRPYGVNDRLFKFPAGYTPTLEDIEELVYFNGDLPDDADLAEWRASR